MNDPKKVQKTAEKTISYEEMIKLFSEYSRGIAEANAYILTAILSEHENGEAIVDKLQALLQSPNLASSPVAHQYLHNVMNFVIEPHSH